VRAPVCVQRAAHQLAGQSRLLLREPGALGLQLGGDSLVLNAPAVGGGLGFVEARGHGDSLGREAVHVLRPLQQEFPREDQLLASRRQLATRLVEARLRLVEAGLQRRTQGGTRKSRGPGRAAPRPPESERPRGHEQDRCPKSRSGDEGVDGEWCHLGNLGQIEPAADGEPRGEGAQDQPPEERSSIHVRFGTESSSGGTINVRRSPDRVGGRRSATM
jgi:hypothetical protein